MKQHLLTAVAVKNAKKNLHDGAGLYLIVSPTGSKSWVLRYRNRVTQKTASIGLGSLANYSLAEAREKAAALRKMAAEGVDLAAHKEAERAALTAATKPVVAEPEKATLHDAFVEYMRHHGEAFRSPKARSQWRSTFETYASHLLDRPLDSINQRDIIEVLSPIWLTKNETATRLQQRLAKILGFARAMGMRSSEGNPATWKDNLEFLMPKADVVVRHHPAMPTDRARDVFQVLLKSDSISAAALRFCILSCLRNGTARQITHLMIDYEQGIIEIPAEITKTNRDFILPLTPAMIAEIQRFPKSSGTDLVFPGIANKVMSENTFLKVQRDLIQKHLSNDKDFDRLIAATVHGWRSTFSDYVAENYENISQLDIDACLQHALGNQVLRAYLRSDVYLKRLQIMNFWSNHLVSHNESD